MNTTARVLTCLGPFTPGIQSMNLIKSRINCNTGFAWNLMDKYHLSDSEFPPAYFVFFENGQETKMQDEKGRILSLLFQILHYENNSQNILFQNMIFNNMKAEAEFRLEQMKQTSSKDYKVFLKLFQNAVSLVHTEIQESHNNGLLKSGLGSEKRAIERQHEIQSELYHIVDKSVRETKTSEQNVNVTAVEKQLYEIEEGNTIFPVLTLQEHQTVGAELILSENKKMPQIIDNQKEYEISQNNKMQEKQEIHQEEQRRDDDLNHSGEHHEKYRQPLREEEGQAPPEEVHVKYRELRREGERLDYGEDENRNSGESPQVDGRRNHSEELREDDSESFEVDKGRERHKAPQENNRKIYGENASEAIGEEGRQERRNESYKNEYEYSHEEIWRKHQSEGWTEFRTERLSELWEIGTEEIRGASLEKYRGEPPEEYHNQRVPAGVADSQPKEAAGYTDGHKDYIQEELKQESETVKQKEQQPDRQRNKMTVFWDTQYNEHQTESQEKETNRTEKIELSTIQIQRSDREQEKKLLEKQLQKLQRKIHEVDYLPSVRAQKVLQYLETLTEEEQNYMAVILGIERNELLEQLRHMDNRGWDALETDIDRCLDTWSGSEPEEASLKQSEAFQENIVASGLLQWKYKLGEWVGFLETEAWNYLIDIVTEHEDTIPYQMSELFKEGDKAAVLGYFEQTESMEELFPLIHLVYRDAGLQEEAAGWLPGIERLIERQSLMKQADEDWLLVDKEKKQQLLRHWAELLEDEEWQSIKRRFFHLKETETEERESYILWLTQLPIACCECILAPAAEILYEKQKKDTAIRLQEIEEQNLVNILKKDIQTNEIQNKIRILEKQSWEQVKNVIFAATRRDVFLESLNSEADLEIAVFLLQNEHRTFFGEKTKAAISEKPLIPEKPLIVEYRQASGLRQWKHSLEEWIGFLEMDTWNLLTDAVTESENLVNSEMKSCFKTKDKRTVLTYMERAESIDELFPFLQLVHKEERLRNEVIGWLPDIERLTECRELMHQADVTVTFMDTEQKKRLIQRWIHLLEEEEWSFTEKESLFHTDFGELEREVYISWMEQLPPKQREQLLMPATGILYRKQGVETERNQEEQKIYAADRVLLLQEEIRTNTIQKRLRSLENQNWKQIVELTSDVIHREVFLRRLEQLSAEEKKMILAPAAEILYRRQNTVIKDRQQKITGERTEQSVQEMLQEEIQKNEIQSRIRTLDTENWEVMKKLTSFTVTKKLFLKHIQQLDSAQEIESVIHNLQMTHRTFYQEQIQKKQLTKKQILTGLGTDTQERQGSFYHLQNHHRAELQSEEYLLEIGEQQEVRMLYRQAVHQWRNLIGIRRQRISDQRSLEKKIADSTIQAELIGESSVMEYDTGIYLKERKLLGTPVLLPLTGKKRGKKSGDKLKVWSPNGLQEGKTANIDFFYETAQMITSRPSGRQTKEMQVMPVMDVEKIVSQVKSETINDIQMVKRQHTVQGAENQNTSQLTSLLSQLSSQQKEMEQMKQVQARLIQHTDMEKITEMVMKQFKTQLRTEKLRRGL